MPSSTYFNMDITIWTFNLLQLRTMYIIAICSIFKGLLPFFFGGNTFFFFFCLIWFSKSNSFHYWFPFFLTTLHISFLFVPHFQHVCVIQIIILKLLKLFFGFSMFWVPIWTPCFNFYNLHHIPSKNIFNDNIDFPWFYHSRLTLSLEKSTHQVFTLISLCVVQFFHVMCHFIFTSLIA